MSVLELFAFAHKNKQGELWSENSLEHPIVFVERFWKWRDSLYVVAWRVLGDSRAAAEVVEVCFRKTSHRPPRFESDGAFGSWLLRILVDEALRARAERRRASKAMRQQRFPKMSKTMASKLECTDESWCLETPL